MDLFGYPYKYVIDTSALVDLKRNYPPKVFQNTVWVKIDNAFNNQLVVSTREVYNEVKRGSDFLVDWVNKHSNSFLYPGKEEMVLVRELQDKYEYFVDWRSEKPHADIWVVACAVHYGLTIIQHEKLQYNKQKLPFVAGELELKYLTLPELFTVEKWEF